jgi:hypothetical protein
MVSALVCAHGSFRLVKRTFWWRSRAEFDVYFVKDFPKVLKWSVCYAKRADATFYHSIHVYYASKTLLRSRFANLSYFS